MNNSLKLIAGAAGLALLALCASLPWWGNGYLISMAINLLMFVILTTAWALFSGSGAYVSLATAAFFGIGAYVVGVLGEIMPWPLVLVCTALCALAVAWVVGLVTLRLRGVYFVIFTFGLTELIRQIVLWYETTISNSVGRYIFLDITNDQILWQLCLLTIVVFVVGGWLSTSARLGLAMRMVGDDEVVARHCGVNTVRTRLIIFSLSAVFMALVGAIVAPRWTYIDPQIAFNPVLSFQVLIMALLGGAARLYGPLLGAIPLVLLFEVLTASFPNYFSILLGIAFIAIVYGVPQGVAGLIEQTWARRFKPAPLSPSAKRQGEAA